MAAVSCVLVEDQFLCSICLEVFTDPVTTACGHSFCKTCINKHWDSSDQYSCPVCKEVFSSRPQIKISSVVAEMVFEFKNNPEDRVNSEPQAAEAGDVLCDVCSEPKLKALKSCLVCLLSYCQSHLEPHATVPRLKGHQLVQALENLEDRTCSQHDKPLELFCRDDLQFICLQCTKSEHKSHEAVPMKEECEVNQADVIQLIKERQSKIEEIQRTVELSQKNAGKEMEEGIRVFNDLMNCIQQSLDEFKQSVEEKHRKTEKEAGELIEKIKSEISSLEQRRAEMEELSASEDHLHFLQTFTSVKPAPSVNDWSKVTVSSTFEGTVAKAVSKLRDNELERDIKKVVVAELNRLQRYAVDVTLDPDTAHPSLFLPGFRMVRLAEKTKDTPNNPRRFSTKPFVMGRQKFSVGRHYFEVQVRNKTRWFVGVAKESVDRRGYSESYPRNGYWLMKRIEENPYRAKFDRVIVSMKSIPVKIGVFVDYEEGLVSFYDADTAELIYSYTNCCFTEDLVPLFCPGNNKDNKNSAPLIVTPVYPFLSQIKALRRWIDLFYRKY